MILLIDSHDSFSHNLRRLIEDNTSHRVITIFNDTFDPSEYDKIFQEWIQYFDWIVIGPGPGHPAQEADVGIVRWLYQHFKKWPKETVPILGVCLGFQSLCYEFGNPVLRLDNVKHGQVYQVYPTSASGLFSGTPFPGVRYHSLHVEQELLNSEIVPLAVCTEDLGCQILMAGRHSSLPLYGVQYHPESVCSKGGDDLIQRFDAIARQYNIIHRSSLARNQPDLSIEKTRAVHEEWLVSSGKFECNQIPRLYAKKFSFLHLDTKPIDVCDWLTAAGIAFVFLNSAADPGDWSIIGLPVTNESEVITHSVDAINWVRLLKYGTITTKTEKIDSIMKFVAAKMQSKYVARNELELKLKAQFNLSELLPFLGGYMGLFSYEAGKHLVRENMEQICTDYTPDCKLVYIERFIIHDRTSLNWYLISIRDSLEEESTCDKLVTSLLAAKDIRLGVDSVHPKVKDYCVNGEQDISYELPDRDVYRLQFGMCQEYLHSGDSYELCLTTQLKITVPADVTPWTIYKILALHKNPSPYSCFMDFDDCVLLSSSPERFISWKDSTKIEGRKITELRPIKGTVRNTVETTLADAERILRTPKEMGENLMVVDLIRHDLQTFTDSVHVDALMAIEEYKTVYQMVTVIQGHLRKTGYKGIDVLQLSLPPGSMTGAPKKRSVELLQKIEALQPTMNSSGRRGIYSGVAGYWSVTDDADWSVIIRSMVHYKKDKENVDGRRVWRIGAGGAITVLSDELGEWEEMHLKLDSTLQTFI